MLFIAGTSELSTEKNFVFKPVVAPSLNTPPNNDKTLPRTSSIPTPKQKPLVIQTGDTEGIYIVELRYKVIS